MSDELPLIIFDPNCPLCLRFKQGLEYLDKSLRFAPLTDETIFNRFPELSRPDCEAAVHMITQDRRILRGPEVVEELLKHLPGVSKLSWLLETERGKKATEFFYQKVEELRELSRKKAEECDQCPSKKS